MKALVIPFPAAKRIGKIRHIVDVAERHSAEYRAKYWRRMLDTFCLQLERAGVPEDEIRRQAHAFREAVALEAELRRIDRQMKRDLGDRPIAPLHANSARVKRVEANEGKEAL